MVQMTASDREARHVEDGSAQCMALGVMQFACGVEVLQSDHI
jgi:hypothetical protein